MTDKQNNPNPAPRGRHVRDGSAQPNRRSSHVSGQEPAQPVQRSAQPHGGAQPRRAQQPSQQATSRQARPLQQQTAQPSGQPRHTAAQQQTQSSQQQPPHQGAQQQARTQRQMPQQQRQHTASGYRPAQTNGMASAMQGGGGSYGGSKGGKATGKKKGGPWKVVFWVALVVLVVALVALGAIAFSYWKGQNSYDAVAQEVFTPPADIEGTALADITVDWDKLRATNPDTVAWIYIPNTRVNYPVVHTTDDEKYLTTDFNGEQTWGATYGTIFLSAANAPDFSDANNIIYGHHLNNGSMFADIADFENPDNFNSHRVVYILTPQGNFKLRTFSLVHCAADDPLAQTAFADTAELATYLQDKADRSVVPVTDAPAMASIEHGFAFATCDSLPTDGRFVLFSYIEESTVANVAAVGATPAPAMVDPLAEEVIKESVDEQAAA